jgi:hypothetical protein
MMTKSPLRPIRPCWLSRAHWTADETCREYARVVDPKYLEEIRAQAKEFSTKRLARRSRLGECTIRNFKNGKGNIRPGSLRKLILAIHDLQNKIMKN